jgi:hypothetical protein
MIEPTNPEETALQLELKKLEIKEKKYYLRQGIKQKEKEEESKMMVDKLLVLNYLITASMIDESKSLIGTDHVYKPVFEEEEIWILKSKIFELVKKL